MFYRYHIILKENDQEETGIVCANGISEASQVLVKETVGTEDMISHLTLVPMPDQFRQTLTIPTDILDEIESAIF